MKFASKTVFYLVKLKKIPFVRIGIHCDPSSDWEHTLKIVDRIKPYQKNIVIITNDNDYLQLADTNIHIINMQFKDITQRGNKDARSDLLNKAIYGDKSDNIQKIAPFITKEKALQLSKMSDDEIRSWLQENNLIDKFNFNMNLISFEKIPCRYVNDFYNHVNILVY